MLHEVRERVPTREPHGPSMSNRETGSVELTQASLALSRPDAESWKAVLESIRDALRLFPGSWTGAAQIHKEAARIDDVLLRITRTSVIPRESAEGAMKRFAILLEHGASPQNAMLVVLRDIAARQLGLR